MHALITHRLTIGLVLSVLLLGEVYRSAFTVQGWMALPVLCIGWSVLVLVQHPRIDKAVPWSIFAFLAWIALTPLWSPYPATAALGVVIALGTALVAYSLTRVATMAEIFDLSRIVLRWAIYGSLAFELVAAVLGNPIFKVGQVVTAETPREISWTWGLLFNPVARIQGLPGNANILAILTILFLVLTVIRVGAERRWNWVIALDLVIGGYVFVRTESATALIALAAAVVVAAMVFIGRQNTRASTVALVISAGVGVTTVVLALLNFDRFTALLGKSPDLTHRFDIWQATIDKIELQPLVGHGYVGFWPMWEPFFAIHEIRGIPVSQAHNSWLDLTLQSGLIGLAIFALAVALLSWRAWLSAIRISTRESLTIATILGVQLVQSITESRLLSEWGLAFIVMFAIATAKRLPSRDEAFSPVRPRSGLRRLRQRRDL